MNSSFFQKISVFTLIIACVVGLLIHFSPLSNSRESQQCNFDEETQCNLSTSSQKISVSRAASIELEEENRLTIRMPPELSIRDAWIQGINMYMGKTAIVLDQPTLVDGLHEYQGVFFLGACSEPKMRWQLVVTLQNEEGRKTPFFFNFSTEY